MALVSVLRNYGTAFSLSALRLGASADFVTDGFDLFGRDQGGFVAPALADVGAQSGEVVIRQSGAHGRYGRVPSFAIDLNGVGEPGEWDPGHADGTAYPAFFKRWRRTLARLPQSRISHHRRLWFLLASTKSQPQLSPPQIRMRSTRSG